MFAKPLPMTTLLDWTNGICISLQILSVDLQKRQDGIQNGACALLDSPLPRRLKV